MGLLRYSIASTLPNTMSKNQPKANEVCMYHSRPFTRKMRKWSKHSLNASHKAITVAVENMLRLIMRRSLLGRADIHDINLVHITENRKTTPMQNGIMKGSK